MVIQPVNGISFTYFTNSSSLSVLEIMGAKKYCNKKKYFSPTKYVALFLHFNFNSSKNEEFLFNL
ncbi:hypothetical protein BpHYR1_041695 [Brachionus plicatilis]|uniref:Uncharacterized protein n=1 Tax=Brachionus plicatilis TaxID=10195 RepID=A0A3M7Q2U2_BRAPC|nr:hypothetical protein BpHYR1_041695 [Brachionus plicatilis]